jgi:hypothetical protein
MSGRSRVASASRLVATSAWAATSSISCSSPETDEAKQSGIRLIVLPAVGQYHRVMRAPSGFFRTYVPCFANPQPPPGWNGHDSAID